jgi:hypothetical protein
MAQESSWDHSGTLSDEPPSKEAQMVQMGDCRIKAFGVALGVLLLSAAACGGPDAGPERGGPGGSPRDDPQTHRTVSIYSSVIRRIVTKDHTFGGGHPRFRVIYVIDGPVKHAEDTSQPVDEQRPEAPFDPEVKQGLRKKLADLPPLKFVQERSSVVAGKEPGHVINRGVLVTLGPISGGRTKAVVGNNLWISGLAGQWLTYVLELQGNDWEVTGTTGPVAIS